MGEQKTYWFIGDSGGYEKIARSVVISARQNLFGGSPSALQIEALLAEKKAIMLGGGVFYKVESATGNLVGYFILSVAGGDASLGDLVLCAPFQNKEDEIVGEINNFIISNKWRNDYL